MFEPAKGLVNLTVFVVATVDVDFTVIVGVGRFKQEQALETAAVGNAVT